jgi:Ca2+/Na+ antiporter
MRRLPATVTSLPELVTGISSVAAAHETDIAVGDVSWPGLALVAIYLLNSYALY